MGYECETTSSAKMQRNTFTFANPPTYIPFLIQIIPIFLEINTIFHRNVTLSQYWNWNDVVLTSFSGASDSKNTKFWRFVTPAHAKFVDNMPRPAHVPLDRNPNYEKIVQKAYVSHAVFEQYEIQKNGEIFTKYISQTHVKLSIWTGSLSVHLHPRINRYYSSVAITSGTEPNLEIKPAIAIK